MIRVPCLWFCVLLVNVEGWNWINIVSRVGMIVHRIETSKWLTSLRHIDLTGGSIYLSLPPDSKWKENPLNSPLLLNEGVKRNRSIVTVTDKTLTPTFLSLQSELDRFEESTTKNLGLVRMHRLGVTALKKVPDSFLFGLLSLIAAELFQRELIRQSLSFPPLVQALANRTVSELDFKLQLLSALQWNVPSFLEYELENLQTQPIEILDKYIISEIITRIDCELAPFLEKYITDPILTKRIITQVKNLVEILAVTLAKNSATTMKEEKDGYNNMVTSRLTLLERIEKALEDVVVEWNKLIEDLALLMKAENFIQFMRINLLTSSISANLTSLSSDNMPVNSTTSLFTLQTPRLQLPSWTRLARATNNTSRESVDS